MNVIQTIEQAARLLDEAHVSFGHGTTNAFDEAAWLVLWLLKLPLPSLDANATRLVSVAEAREVDALIQRRIRERKPAAYLTGEAWLHGVPFYVDERVIVPRSLIAEPLVDGSLDAWLSSRTERVLDLCTGNGSLAILAAMAWPDIRVDGADLSAPALAVAARNVQRHGLEARIQLHQGDGLRAVAGRRYDLILCNPPYVNQTSMAALPDEYRAEPTMALDGGPDGMDFVRQLMLQAPAAMNPEAVLVLEIGHEQSHFQQAFPRLDALWIETSGGEACVALLTREALIAS
jgi:ribosomal protein L3 glutamine methyltransferase